MVPLTKRQFTDSQRQFAGGVSCMISDTTLVAVGVMDMARNSRRHATSL